MTDLCVSQRTKSEIVNLCRCISNCFASFISVLCKLFLILSSDSFGEQ